MRSASRHVALWVLAAAVIACAPTGTGTRPADSAAGGGGAETLAVGLTDFAITTSTGRLADGSVTVQVTNAGATAHDLRISGDDVDRRSRVLPPGATTTMTIPTIGEDTLTLWCTLPGHRQRGMETTVSVQD